jgi:hypothetical protein
LLEVDGQNYLGIYLSNSDATVVCVGPQGRDGNVLGCFSISLEEQEDRNTGADMRELARLIVEGCAERELKFSEVAVALDCAMFMQHSVHSEFKEPRQIAQTVRFDTEEALSMDITDVAVAFKVTSSDETGSELTVFTAQREVLSDVLLSLQSNNIDPIAVEPDVNCLSRFIVRNVSLPEESNCLFGMFSRRSGYFLTFAGSREARAVRTLLIGRGQDRSDLIARQIPIVAALAGAGGPISCVKVSDSADSVNYQQLSEKLGIEVGGVDLPESVAAGPEVLADCADTVDFAIAYGAALAHLEKVKSVNFRNDFMRYEGKKLGVQKALKFLSISVTVLMLALGVYVTLQLLRTNKYRSRLHAKFRPQYSAMMPRGKKSPTKLKEAVKKLSSVKREIDRKGKGVTAAEGVAAKLTLLLGAFNKCAAPTKLNVDLIYITDRTITISGETSSRKSTLKLREAIKQSKLGNLHETIKPMPKTRRSSFRITIEPKKVVKGKA